MTFEEAKAALKEMAQGRYHSISFELTEYQDGRAKPMCSVYIENLGWTSDHATFEDALQEMGRRVNGTSATIDDVFPA